jgi:hypothetical protein
MAMDPMDREPNVNNRETNVYDNTKRGSNTLAYVIGGLVVALGLLAFLFYDGGSNEPSTTGSTGTQTQSSSPSTGSTAPATPTTPSAPAAPASPASPSAPANPQ